MKVPLSDKEELKILRATNRNLAIELCRCNTVERNQHLQITVLQEENERLKARIEGIEYGENN
jgi:hypothetical protein